VVTRSQAKLRTATGPNDGLSPVLPVMIGSTDGLSTLSQNTRGSTDELLDSPGSFQAFSCPPLSFDESLVTSLLDPLSISTAFEFQNLKSNNLEFSKSNSFEFSNSSVIVDQFSYNLPTLTPSLMEGDCDKKIPSGLSQPKQDVGDFQQLFITLTTEMTSHMEQLHTRLAENDLTLRSDQDLFKQEVRSELLGLQSLLQSSSSSLPSILSSQQPVTTSPPNPMSVSPSVPSVSAPSITTSISSSGSDIQAQMMLMLTESFQKLTAVMGDQKTSEAKSQWPKFAGDAKKFRSWFLAIMAQLSIHPWSEFYDAATNSPVSTTQNTLLNGKLYAKLISVLESQALQDMITRSHLRGNGLLLLNELVETYKPTNFPEVLAAKAGEFWSKTQRAPHESVDTYYNRFRELLDDLDQAEDRISTKSAMRNFIFMLGQEFESIQNKNFK
jgi:hypothetical protein